MQVRQFLLVGMLCALSYFGWAQSAPTGTITGTVRAAAGGALPGIHIRLDSLTKATVTDADGRFRFSNLTPGTYVLTGSGVSFITNRQTVSVRAGETSTCVLVLNEAVQTVDEVAVTGQATTQDIRKRAFAVEAIDALPLQNRNVDMNRLLDRTMGVQVRETGGMGSDFTYSIQGLSGKAVKFFIDGVPMESFGSSYRINNVPINLVDRIEVYKGVVPVELAGDALGGAVNLITRRDVASYLDASYSIGSFGTHRAAFSGRWRQAKTGFTTNAHLFYNASKNNYPVWGRTIEIAGPDGRPLPDVGRLRRFNDDYQSANARLEVGFTNVRWADRLLLALTVTDLERGIQTGRTMAFVYGEVRYRERLLMPSLTFAKKDLFIRGLNVDAFASLNSLQGTTVDTSSRKYNWRGEVIASNVRGELGGIRAQRSLYTFDDRTALAGVNLAYQPADGHRFILNALHNQTRRTGSDALAIADWTIPFRLPQQLSKQIMGLSYEQNLLDARLTNTVFVKYYRYAAQANAYDYNGGAQRELLINRQQQGVWGFGLASTYQLHPRTRLKLSAESATRLPDALELLGDGNTILNAPGLQPEQSMNANASVQYRLSRTNSSWNIASGLFFRHTNNLIWLGEADLFGTARYENLNRIQTLGVETEVQYRYRNWLRLTANATYQDIRNKLRYTTAGAPNHVFNDRLRNTPYLLANAEISLTKADLFWKGALASCYVGTHYVPEYFLGWPSLGAKATKRVIPTQFLQDIGAEFTAPNRRYVVGVDCRNLLDQQVYDNYLLQKPGRFISLKVRYFLSQSSSSNVK
ncbi:TonB-dependent receptor [Spirosoma oryzicola]|uniref:TonB-dependent receptor n=1 Tax=Spirosoma oryzicola TaxID=2898794 RepID=UPI001E619514|nr:TonB-dependent receptor [Spirosoma oryzicola]UHG93758.1 TonB-dependent receptor plug domain-containing protein [Spirosoma oryzicola]